MQPYATKHPSYANIDSRYHRLLSIQALAEVKQWKHLAHTVFLSATGVAWKKMDVHAFFLAH